LNSENNLQQDIRKKIEHYEGEVESDKLQHLKTRRLGATAIFFGLLGFVISLIDQFAGLHSYVIAGTSFISDEIVGGILLSLTIVATVSMYAASSEQYVYLVNKLFFASSIIVLLFTNSFHGGYIFFGAYLILYICCYGLNRQQGYTKLWARHQRLVCQLELLEWDFNFKINELNELDNVLKKQRLEKVTSKTKDQYLVILEKHAFERQADIVGDYLSTNDAAFSWIKSLKK